MIPFFGLPCRILNIKVVNQKRNCNGDCGQAFGFRAGLKKNGRSWTIAASLESAYTSIYGNVTTNNPYTIPIIVPIEPVEVFQVRSPIIQCEHSVPGPTRNSYDGGL